MVGKCWSMGCDRRNIVLIMKWIEKYLLTFVLTYQSNWWNYSCFKKVTCNLAVIFFVGEGAGGSDNFFCSPKKKKTKTLDKMTKKGKITKHQEFGTNKSKFYSYFFRIYLKWSFSSPVTPKVCLLSDSKCTYIRSQYVFFGNLYSQMENTFSFWLKLYMPVGSQLRIFMNEKPSTYTNDGWNLLHHKMKLHWSKYRIEGGIRLNISSSFTPPYSANKTEKLTHPLFF